MVSTGIELTFLLATCVVLVWIWDENSVGKTLKVLAVIKQ